MKILLQEVFLCLFLGAQFLQTCEWLTLLKRVPWSLPPRHTGVQKNWPLFLTLIKIPLIMLALIFLRSQLLGVILGLLLALELYSCKWVRVPLNGASSGFNLLIYICVFFAKLFPDSENFFYFYIILQVVLSYFIAGIVKVRHEGWRSGVFLESFLQMKAYAADFPKKVVQRISFRQLSWILLLFELSFPLVIVQPKLFFIYLPAAAAFHAINFKVLGLNRFFWIWISTYPLLISYFVT